MKQMLFLFLIVLWVSIGRFTASEKIERTTFPLTGSGWSLWLDTKAQWENDELYLPSQVTDISKLPNNPPTHGLSHTNFTYSDIEINKTTAGGNDEIMVLVKVKNTDNYDGEEVVQLYISDVKSDLWMPIKQLRKFQRISLRKGEEKTVEFIIKPSADMHYYDPMKRSYTVEPGAFEIQVGASSEDIRVKRVVTVK